MKNSRHFTRPALIFCGLLICAMLLIVTVTSLVKPDPLADDLKVYGALFKRGFDEELIFKIAEMEGEPEPRLLYYRGLAHYRFGRYSLAKADLVAALDAEIYYLPDGYDTQWTLDSIERLLKLMPPNAHEILRGERVLFRMHYSGIDDGVVTVARVLPRAYRFNRELFGADFDAIEVIIFETYDQFRAFYQEVTGDDKIGNWIWAAGQDNLAMISLQYPDGSSSFSGNPQKFISIVTHEINHAMFYRLMGRSEQPRWFEEGLAQVAQAQADGNYAQDHQHIWKRLFANNALLPIEKISDDAGYTEHTERGLAMSKSPQSESAPDTYAQSYGMMKFLLDKVSPAQFQSFLKRARASENFEGAFKAEFGITSDQFYQQWKREFPQQLTSP